MRKLLKRIACLFGYHTDKEAWWGDESHVFCAICGKDVTICEECIEEGAGFKAQSQAKVQCNACGKWWSAIPPVLCCGVFILDEMLDRKEKKMERLKWCLKQLLPLIYVTTFTAANKRQLCIWRMWMGRCFNIRRFNLAS